MERSRRRQWLPPPGVDPALSSSFFRLHRPGPRFSNGRSKIAVFFAGSARTSQVTSIRFELGLSRLFSKSD